MKRYKNLKDKTRAYDKEIREGENYMSNLKELGWNIDNKETYGLDLIMVRTQIEKES